MIYGYCRVSTKHQRITRQVTNITAVYPNAIIIREFYTGTVQQRPLWDKLVGQIQKGDTIVFDSVSRMSRCASEGYKDYKMLYEMGVELVFLNEPLINSSIYDSSKANLLNISIATGNEAVDDFFKGILVLLDYYTGICKGKEGRTGTFYKSSLPRYELSRGRRKHEAGGKLGCRGF